MIKGLIITDFMAIAKLELEFTAPLNIFAGQNEAGKSSIRDALLWGFTGQARGLKTHGDQAALIREGAKVAEVTIAYQEKHQTFDHVQAFTRRKTQKTAATVMGDIPDIGLNPALLFDPYTFLSWPEGDRRELLFKIIPGLNPTADNVFDRLVRWPAVEALGSHQHPDQAVSATDLLPDVVKEAANQNIIRSIAKMAASHGFPGVEKECVTKRREAKRVRDEYKGATEPEKTLAIDGQEFDIPTLNLPAIEATLKDLQKEKDDLLRQKGAGEARVKRLATVQGQLEKIGTLPLPLAEDFIRLLQQDLQDNKNALEDNSREIEQTAVKNQSFPVTCPAITLEQIPCPKAGQKVGAEPTAPGVLEALTQNRQGLIKKSNEINNALSAAHQQVTNYQVAVEKKKNLEEELARLQSEPEAGADLDAEIATRQRRIDRGVAFDRAVHDYNLALGRYQDTLTRLAAAEQEVIIYDALQKALSPDGIPSQMIAEALDGINELLEDAASYFFPGRYLHLTGELGIVLQNSPYITLSKSAKYRVGVAFQYALARLTGARILLIDEADILDDDRQGDLIKFLLAKVADFDQIMVFMTCTEPPDFVWEGNEMQVWWLENGAITKVEGK